MPSIADNSNKVTDGLPSQFFKGFLSRSCICQLQHHRNLTTESSIRPTALADGVPQSSAEGPLIVDFEEEIKKAALERVEAHQKSTRKLKTKHQSNGPLSTKLEEYQVRKASTKMTRSLHSGHFPSGNYSLVDDYIRFWLTKKCNFSVGTTGDAESKIGAVLEPHYKPHELITNPPSPRDITLELLLASGAHLGHATALWNPGNQRYIFGIRQGIHLISLDIIASHLRRAAKIVHGVSMNGGIILFVGTRDGQERAVIEAARRTKGFHITERWVPGTITNKQQLLGDQKLRVLNQFDEEIPLTEEQKKRLEEKLAKLQSDQGKDVVQSTLQVPQGAVGAVRPDLVVCLNPLENQTMLQECAQYRIPTIGIIDTDVDPTCVTYPIPANDDSLRSVQLIAGVLGRAGEEGRLARYEAEKERLEELEKRKRRVEEAKRREEEELRKARMDQEAELEASEARQNALERL
ncbi:hypothetical protein ABW19_dt0210547 [Dactylella cylindrospora]|nr:hypothetical protein ABW19_dt0210547 [Dactylella cylindrospora]